MKKILVILYIMAMVLAARAQVVTLRFTGTDRTMQDYVRLHHVSVYDNDQLWHQVIYYPDTTLSLYDKGALDIEENGYDTPLKLFQNTPNPFSGSTDVMLSTAEEGAVTLEVTDMQGRIVANISVPSLLPDSHQFCITLATSGTYVTTARQNGRVSSIKMACNAGGGSNTIVHVGSTNSDGTVTVFLKNMMVSGSYPFKLGDRMSYKGYAMIDGTERMSEAIEKQQRINESSYTMKFDVARPEVTTLATTDVTPYTATLNGEVTAENNALTERGFCWTSGTAWPTIANNRLTAGEGIGTYSATIADGLVPGETYRVRAYAINAVGISYGSMVSFTTLAVIPEVVTNDATELTVSSATLNGEVTYNGGASVTARGFQYGTDADNLASSVSLGTGTGTLSTTISDLADNTTYFYRAYATNSAGTAYGEIKSFTTVEILLPSITTLQATDITRTSLTLNASITSDGGSAVTARGFYWGTAEDNLPNYVDSEQATADFFASVGDLTPNTVYYYRAAASNVKGTGLGEVLSVRTNPLNEPIVTTNDATNITANSAVLNGSITSDGGTSITSCGFYWGTDADNMENNVVSDITANDFSANIIGLTYSTTYYYKAYATNSIGTAYGEVLQFTTEAILPTVQTLSAMNITSSGATLNGNVVSDGGAIVTARGFYWGADADNLENNVISDITANDFSANIIGLTYSTTYYYKAYATNNAGTAYGEVMQFTTEAILPTVQTLSATDITSSGATLNGNVVSDGGAIVTDRGFVYGTSVGNLTQIVQSGSGTGNFIGAITGLTYSTTYYYKAYATNSVGTTYGEVMQFTTEAILPTVQTLSATIITSTDATLNGNVTSDGGADVTACGFMYGTSESCLTQNVQVGSGTGSFNKTLTTLYPGTTYYYKAYATNSVGTAYGEVLQFTTEAILPTVQTLSATDITSTDATLNGNVTSDGGATVTDRGFMYGTRESELTQTLQSGNGIGNFTNTITGLTHSTTYFYKAYATNSVGTSYGEVLQFTTEDIEPTVQTLSATDVTSTDATLNGNVANDGGADVTDRGFLYGTSESNLTQTVQSGSGIGTFTSVITGLVYSTTYYYTRVRDKHS